MMISDRLINAFERIAKELERQADTQEQRIAVAQGAIDLQKRVADATFDLKANIDDAVKFVADLRGRIAGLRKETDDG